MAGARDNTPVNGKKQLQKLENDQPLQQELADLLKTVVMTEYQYRLENDCKQPMGCSSKICEQIVARIQQSQKDAIRTLTQLQQSYYGQNFVAVLFQTTSGQTYLSTNSPAYSLFYLLIKF